MNNYNKLQGHLLLHIDETIELLKDLNILIKSNYDEFYKMEEFNLMYDYLKPLELAKLVNHNYFDTKEEYFVYYEYIYNNDKIISMNSLDIIEYIENNIEFIERDLIENITELFLSEDLQEIIYNM